MLTATMNEQKILPSTLRGYRWQSARREDIPALYEMMLAVDRADDRGFTITLQDMQTQYDDPWCDPETDFRLAFTPGGQVAAMARVFVNPLPNPEEHRAHFWGEIHPEHRGRGLEELILDWLEQRGQERLQSAHDGKICVLRIGLPDNLADFIALIERRGFCPVRHFNRMRRDLGQPIPAGPLPEGLSLRCYSPQLERLMLETFNASFQDHWGFELASEQDWQMFYIQSSSFRPDLTFVAMDGERVAGLSLNMVHPEANERQNIREGWITELGVRREWRKRGVATALLCQAMRAFEAEGLDYATLGVDAASPTGALRLYERLGFVPVKRFVTFAKPVG